jgi:hypothetical protein
MKGWPYTATRGANSGVAGPVAGELEFEELELDELGDVLGDVLDELVLDADVVLDEDLVVVLLGGRVLVLVLVVGTAV